MSREQSQQLGTNLKVIQIIKQLHILEDLVSLLLEEDLSHALADQRRLWVQPIKTSEQIAWEKRLHDDESFFSFTRLSIAQFDELLNLVDPVIIKQNTRKKVLSPYIRLLITLKFLATGESFVSLHKTFSVGYSTIGKVVYSTCAAIKEVLQPQYLPALTKERLSNIADGFCKRTTYPHIVGAIDSKHINIKAPKKSDNNFVYYKNSFSVLAVCDSQSRFTYINVGGYGSEAEGGSLRNSMIADMLDKEKIDLPEPELVNGVQMPFYFVGDAAFPLRPYIMTPYSDRELEPDMLWHNRELWRGKFCIENAFGLLAARFLVFSSTMGISPDSAESIVMTAVLLHNFIMDRDHQRYANQSFVDHFDTDGNLVEGEWRQITQNSDNQILLPLPTRFRMGDMHATSEANSIRDNIKNLLFNNRK